MRFVLNSSRHSGLTQTYVVSIESSWTSGCQNSIKIRKNHPVPEKNRKNRKFWKVLGIDCRFGGNERDIGKHRKNPEKSSGSGKNRKNWKFWKVLGIDCRFDGNEKDRGKHRKNPEKSSGSGEKTQKKRKFWKVLGIDYQFGRRGRGKDEGEGGRRRSGKDEGEGGRRRMGKEKKKEKG